MRSTLPNVLRAGAGFREVPSVRSLPEASVPMRLAHDAHDDACEAYINRTELVARIETFRDSYNPQARPFVWTATADSIFDKVQKICKAISGTEH